MKRTLLLLVAAVSLAGCMKETSPGSVEPAARELPICPEYLPVVMPRPSPWSAASFFGEKEWDQMSEPQREKRIPEVATDVWKQMREHLYKRPAVQGFRQMIATIEANAADWQQLILLEEYDERFVLYAKTDAGWRCFTNVTSSKEGASLGRVVQKPIDSAWVEQWLSNFRKLELPEVALASHRDYVGGFTLHIIGGEREGWTCFLRDTTADAVIRGYPLMPETGPVPPSRLQQLRDAMKAYRGTRDCPSTQPHFVLGQASDDYPALRNAYMRPVADLWQKVVPPPDFAAFGGKRAAFAALETLTDVGGSAVGAAGTPGDFYLLCQAFIHHATREDIERLLRSDKPIVCAMGLTAAAHSSLPDQVKLITAKFNRRDGFSQSPFGCMFQSMSVGEFAMTMLLNPAYLEDCVEAPALVDPGVLALYVLSQDQLTHLQLPCGEDLAECVDDGGLPLDLAALKRLWPGSDDLLLIRALGRAAWNEKIHGFLARCLRDKSLAPHCRLAAASGLTRYPKEADVQVLKENQAMLDGLEKGAGARLLDDARRRAAFWQVLLPERSPFGRREPGEALKGVAGDLTVSLVAHEFVLICRGDDTILAKRIKAVPASYPAWDVFSDQPWAMLSGLLYTGQSTVDEWNAMMKPRTDRSVPGLPPAARRTASTTPAASGPASTSPSTP